jgi:hypothetical protein
MTMVVLGELETTWLANQDLYLNWRMVRMCAMSFPLEGILNARLPDDLSELLQVYNGQRPDFADGRKCDLMLTSACVLLSSLG